MNRQRRAGGGDAVSIFGSAFARNLVADGYAGYNTVNPLRIQAIRTKGQNVKIFVYIHMTIKA